MNNIHQPSHYMSNGEETIVKIVREIGIVGAMDFCKGNIIKYADRANYKGQKESDLKKIQEYTKMANDLREIRNYVVSVVVLRRHYDLDYELIELVKKWSENGHSLKGIIDE